MPDARTMTRRLRPSSTTAAPATTKDPRLKKPSPPSSVTSELTAPRLRGSTGHASVKSPDPEPPPRDCGEHPAAPSHQRACQSWPSGGANEGCEPVRVRLPGAQNPPCRDATPQREYNWGHRRIEKAQNPDQSCQRELGFPGSFTAGGNSLECHKRHGVGKGKLGLPNVWRHRVLFRRPGQFHRWPIHIGQRRTQSGGRDAARDGNLQYCRLFAKNQRPGTGGEQATG